MKEVLFFLINLNLMKRIKNKIEDVVNTASIKDMWYNVHIRKGL